MSGIFSQPKVPKPLPVVNPEDTQNRLNTVLARKLAQGGTSSTVLGSAMGGAPTGGARSPTLTGVA